MVFSSVEFLYLFLPLIIIVYFIVPRRLKNVVLLIFSYIFYAFGEPVYILLMVFSSVLDYVVGRSMEATEKDHIRKILLVVSLIANISLLGVFKYYDFIIESMNYLLGTSLPLKELPLPIGISFFTFQTMSYSIDVYRRRVPAQKNFLNFATYVSMFPQLIAGPIVRYADINEQLDTRTHSVAKFSEGIERFVYGLGKKVLIANNIGLLADQALSGNQTMLSTWLYAFAFGMQIYFDFSGYSDMAIGLGKMFGFDFKENFDYPYISKSITEFWRRWHMSLGAWFRDYLYIPLGGNRVKVPRFVLNILIVWAVTGLWHGASFNFVVWGLFFGIILLIEKLVLSRFVGRGIGSHIYVVIVLLVSWLIFTSEDITMFTNLMKGFVGAGVPLVDEYSIFLVKEGMITFLVAILFATPFFRKVRSTKWYKRITPIWLMIILLVSTAYIVDSSFNPFLYFRF